MDIGMRLQPAVLLRFVGVEIVQDDVNLPAGIVGHDPIHKVQELPAAPTPIVARSHLAGHNIQRRKQSGRAMAFVAMAEAVHGRAVGKANKSLRALQMPEYEAFRQHTEPGRSRAG